MAHLADFVPAAREAREEIDTIGFCGQLLQVEKEVDGYLTLEFSAALESDGDDLSSLAVVDKLFRSCLVKASYDTFRSLCREKALTLEEISEFALILLGAVSARPTKRPSGSTSGPSPTSTTSNTTYSQLSLQLNGEGS